MNRPRQRHCGSHPCRRQRGTPDHDGDYVFCLVDADATGSPVRATLVAGMA